MTTRRTMREETSGYSADDYISANVAVHDRIASRYDATHGEIFNPIEQDRLKRSLERAAASVLVGRPTRRALDFGCGSGNLTRHLLDLGFEVVAADVSAEFLRRIGAQYNGAAVQTLQLNGRDLSGAEDGSFDVVATYSVLHHIPDYLTAVQEMVRVCASGGVVYIDHEHNPQYWSADAAYKEYERRVRRRDLKKYLQFRNYVHKFRRMLNPRHTNEGDIHVWPDDHIQWDAIGRVFASNGCEIVLQEDYLLFRDGYHRDVFDQYQSRLTDFRVVAARKTSGSDLTQPSRTAESSHR